jgi:hypothetical protein
MIAEGTRSERCEGGVSVGGRLTSYSATPQQISEHRRLKIVIDDQHA